jgi:hypothetical protein
VSVSPRPRKPGGLAAVKPLLVPPPPHPAPRAQVGSGLLRHFGGRAAALVGAARGSAAALVELLAAHFPGFRDHAVYRGRQVGRPEGGQRQREAC